MALKPNELIPILPNRSGQQGWDQATFAAEVNAVVSGGGGITIEDEGTPLVTDADTLNFVGAGVTASGTGTTKTITIPGGGVFQTTGIDNIFGGTNALANITTGSTNFAGMADALNSVTIESFNTALGGRAGRRVASNSNTAIGYQAVSGVAAPLLTGSDNTGLGARAGEALQGTATFNTCVGAFSGSRINTGDFNTIVGGRTTSLGVPLNGDLNAILGYEAGFALSFTGSQNTFLGARAGRAVNFGSDMVCLGHDAGPTSSLSSQLFIDITQRNDPLIGGDFSARTVSLQNMVFDADQSIGLTEDNYVLTYDDGTGLISLEPAAGGVFQASASNIFGGTNALASLTSGIHNFAALENALTNVDAGAYNIGIGRDAGGRIQGTGGTSNVAIGYAAVSGIAGVALTGGNNCGVGYEAISFINGATNFNTALGSFAGSRNGTGEFNTFIGARTGDGANVGSGDLNVLLGYQAGRTMRGASANNTLIGSNAGDAVTTGSNMVCLGRAAGPAANASAQLHIDITQRDDSLIFGNFTTRLVEINGRLESDGDTANTSFRIDNNATAGETRMLLWDVDNGTLERVSVGAADSGGAGFKVLRIPN